MNGEIVMRANQWRWSCHPFGRPSTHDLVTGRYNDDGLQRWHQDVLWEADREMRAIITTDRETAKNSAETVCLEAVELPAS